MKQSQSPVKTFAQTIVFVTPFLLPLAGAQVVSEVELPIPSNRFTPPPPPRKVPPMVIKASTVTRLATHNITLIRGEPSTLPDIPPPPVTKPSKPEPERETHYHVLIGATVYDHNLSLVTWTNPETKESFEAWCGWDFTLLSPLAQIDINQKFSSFYLSASNIDTAEEKRLGHKVDTPVYPKVIADGFVISRGDASNTDANELLTTLRNYYICHKARLILIKKAQQEYQASAAAWHEANPPKPENHTFWLKPHRGSRYLTKEGGQ
jgi:hypothetical protein